MVKRNETNDWASPKRQSPVAIVLILFRVIKMLFKQAWPILLLFIFNQKNKTDNTYSLAFTALGVLSSVMSIISYFRFYYYIEGDELVLKKGLFKKTKINVPFDRIQSINSSQNLVHRFFNVVSLEMDTAGSKGSEIKISALSLQEAEDLKKYILGKKILSDSLKTDPTESKIEPFIQTEKKLLQLSIADLLKIGIGQNHLRSLSLIALFIFGLGEYADMLLEREDFEQIENHFVTILKSSFIILVILAIILSLVLTLLRTIIRYYGLNFSETEKGFKVISGLFDRKEKFAALKKIQLFQWSINPISQIFKLYDLSLSLASSVQSIRGQTMQVPGLYLNQIQDILKSYFPKRYILSFSEHGISWRIIIKRINLYGFPPLGIVIIERYITKAPFSPWMLLWLVLIFFTSYIFWKKWKFKLSTEGIETQSGIFSTNFTLLKWYKVQSIIIRQSIFQKRLGFADIHFSSAGGTVSIPYIPYKKALQMKNFVLYKVETSKKHWM